MDAGAWASVKTIPCLANLSKYGVLRVFSIGLYPLIKLVPRYALVSPKPISSAIKITMFGIFFGSEKSSKDKRFKPVIRWNTLHCFIYFD
jgi:hypothetical protein